MINQIILLWIEKKLHLIKEEALVRLITLMLIIIIKNKELILCILKVQKPKKINNKVFPSINQLKKKKEK